MDENIKVKTVVWVITDIGINKSEIVELKTYENKNESFKFYKLYSLDNYWHYGAKLENIFLTENDAKNELKKREQEDYQTKLESIKSIEDLLNFMYVRMFSEEYTDWAGIKVAEDKAKEFGYNLNK